MKWLRSKVQKGPARAYSFPEFEASARTPRELRLLVAGIALLVSLAAFLDFWGVDAIEDSAEADQLVLNLAGRQRMWSQRLPLLALRLAACRNGTDAGTTVAECDRFAEQIKESAAHMLRERMQLLEIARFAAIAEAAPPVESLHKAALSVVEAAARESPSSLEQPVRTLNAAADAFLPQMGRAVAMLQSASEAAVQETESTHGLTMTALALVVSLLALGAGERIARRMSRQHSRLVQQAAELERLALVAEHTENAVIVADADGRVTWANDAFTRISGYSLYEVLGKKPGSLLQFEGTNPEVRQQLRSAIGSHKAVQVQVLNRAKNGRHYWLQLDIQPLRDDEGGCVGFIAVQTDITQQVLERDRLATLLRSLPAGVVQQDTGGRITDVNPEACRILGLTPEQLLGRESIDPRWRTVNEAGVALPGDQHPAMQALTGGKAVRGVLMGLAMPDGERRWLRVNAEPLRGSDGAVVGVVSSFADVTEALSQRRLLSLTVDGAGLGTWDWNIAVGGVGFNERWWKMLGYQPGALPPELSSWEALVHPHDLPAAKRALQTHFDHPAEPYRCEYRMRRADGAWAWIMAAGSVIDWEPGGTPRRMAGIHLDITQRKQLEQRLADAALTDMLTGLPNRAALQARLAQCSARALRDREYRYAVLFMDFDRFKQVNDSLGHEAGDELLRQIAERLRTTLRTGDDVARLDSSGHTAARLGGDEFVALLEPLHRLEDATSVAQRLLDALALPYSVSGQELCSTVSIGIVTSERDDCDPVHLLRDADMAMYEAKRRGRGQYVVFSADR